MQLVSEKKEFREVLSNRQIFLFFCHFSCALIKPGTQDGLIVLSLRLFSTVMQSRLLEQALPDFI